MDPKMRVEVDRFNQAMAQIGRVTNDPTWQNKVIDHEVTKILEVAMQRTKRATAASIKRSNQARGPWRTYDIGRGKKKYRMDWRYPNTIWRALLAAENKVLQRKLNAREFARQAWLELANALGFTVKSTAQTKAANIPGVNNRANVRAEAGGSNGRYGIALENNSPLVRFSEARQAIFSAIVGRRKYFETSMRKAYGDRIAPLVERYGLRVY